jgi:hypothetical protein
MIHVWLFDNPGGSFATGIGGTPGIRIAERELEAPVPVAPASPAPASPAPASPAPAG